MYIQQLIIESNTSINICWVPSHIGVPLNERADAAARNAAQQLEISPIPIPRSDHKCEVKRAIVNFLKNKWNNETNNKYHEIQPTLSTSSMSTSSNRSWQCKVNRLRLGHTKLTHGFLMERSERPLCGDCDTPLTVRHIIVECPVYEDERRRCFGQRPTSLREALTIHSVYQGNLHRFLRDIDIIQQL